MVQLLWVDNLDQVPNSDIQPETKDPCQNIVLLNCQNVISALNATISSLICKSVLDVCTILSRCLIREDQSETKVQYLTGEMGRGSNTTRVEINADFVTVHWVNLQGHQKHHMTMLERFWIPVGKRKKKPWSCGWCTNREKRKKKKQ